jgi:mannitol/fructose-specific phosphotransferase system IIA component (Ntr-type)
MATLAKKARDREKRIPSGVLGEVAIAHMTLPGVKQPVVAAGISPAGLDFQASDRHPARAIFLVVVPEGGSQQELEILEEISDTFLKPGLIAMATEARNYTEFLAVLKTSSAEHG